MDAAPLYNIESIFIDINTGEELTDTTVANQEEIAAKDIPYYVNSIHTGSPELAEILCIRHGVVPEVAPGANNICEAYTVGFSEKEQKWYGWSHFSYEGFGIGSRVEPGHLAYRPKNRVDFLEMIWREYEGANRSKYKNIKVRAQPEGISIEYDLVDENELLPDPALNAQLQALIKEFNISNPPKLHTEHQVCFFFYPEEYGMGTWEAKTLDDAKQMAIDFANGSVAPSR